MRKSNFLQNLPRRILTPLPLPLLQPVLHRIVTRVALRRPEFFSRLGTHKNKRYLIDPLNMPFVFVLSPDPKKPSLRAARRSRVIAHDARIAGTFLTLLDMVDGRLDGDALFFTRDLIIEGDTEAVVVLRNALDDLEGSIADDIAASLGFPVQTALTALHRIKKDRYDSCRVRTA